MILLGDLYGHDDRRSMSGRDHGYHVHARGCVHDCVRAHGCGCVHAHGCDYVDDIHLHDVVFENTL